MSTSLAVGQSYGRKPRLRIDVGGETLNNPLRASIRQNNAYQASTFEFSVATTGDKHDLAWWSSQASITAEVFIGFLQPDVPVNSPINWVSMIYGVVDEINIDFINKIIYARGRDMTALLIDSRTNEVYPNQTASEVVSQIAANAGMQAQVVPTTRKIGRYYDNDHVRTRMGALSETITRWDLVVWLAAQEYYDAYVKKNTLYFQPAQSESTAPVFNVHFSTSPRGANVETMVAKRFQTIAGKITVKVLSWNTILEKTITASVTGSANTGKTVTNPQTYVFFRPNLTKSQALTLAQSKLKEITRHEKVITVTMPGDTILTPRHIVRVAGTGTNFDQDYFPDVIIREIDFHSGYRQEVVLKNSSANMIVQESE